MQLKLSPEAVRDLSAIHEFGALQYGLQQADDYLDELAAALASIERMPFASRERDECGRQSG
jgi:plasmid stabilization system protein ParE